MKNRSVKISFPIDFSPEIYGLKVAFFKIQQFPDYLEINSVNFCTFSPRFEIFGIF